MRQKITWKQAASFIPFLAAEALIFYFSAQPSDISSSESLVVTQHLVAGAGAIMHLDLNLEQILQYSLEFESFVRKAAHFTEYFFLLWSIFLPLRKSFGMTFSRAAKIALALVALLAASDEFHQYFVPGRSSQLRDVLIDTAGGLTGLIVLYLIHRSRSRKKTN